MKQRFYLFSFVLLAMMFVSKSAKAQQVDVESGQVVWMGTKITDILTTEGTESNFVYMVQFKETLSSTSPEQYMSSGGAYGVQGVLSAVGMRVQIIKSKDSNKTSYYQVLTRVENSGNSAWQGDRLGFDGADSNKPIYLDRGEKYASNNFVNWELNESSSTKSNIRYNVNGVAETTAHIVTGIQTYTLQSGDNSSYYITVNNQGRLVTTTNADQATKWVLVSEDDYSAAMASVTWGEVDLGVFVQDAEFGRDNKDAYYWEWGTWSGTDWNKYPEGTDPNVNENNTQDDYWYLGSSTTLNNDMHWHQRNQDKMCNGVNLDNGISRARIGENVAGTGSGNVDHDGFRNSYGQYYKAEIFNEAIALSQTLNGSNIPNLTKGLYKLTVQALYHDGSAGTTNNNVSFFVVKRVEHTENGDEVTIQRLPVKPINSESNQITRASGVSAGKVMNDDHNKYLLEFFLEISGNTEITIGIEQQQATGWTVIGNVHLYAHGQQALFLDEDWTDNMTIPYVENGETKYFTGDPYVHTRFYEKYDYPATVYYNRTMTTNKWNTIVLPFNLTGNQIRQAFGNDCLVSEFEGMDNVNSSVIKFTAAKDLFTEGMKADVPYIIKPTIDPSMAKGESMTLEVGNGHENHTVTIDGPIYELTGVKKSQTTSMPSPQEVTCPNTGLTFTGSYYKKVLSTDDINGRENPNGEHNYWVINKGNMYHLTGSKAYNIWGTYCYIYDKNDEFKYSASAGSKKVSIRIDGVEELDELVTAIDGLYIDSDVDSNSVYNISGQRVGGTNDLNSLPKGIYIVNGKKFVVK